MSNGINKSFQGDKFTWEIDAGGQLTVNGTVVLFVYFKGPLSSGDRPVEGTTQQGGRTVAKSFPMIINERGISVGKTVIAFDCISAIHQINKYKMEWIVFIYQQ